MKILKNIFFSLFILLIFTNSSWSKSASEFITSLTSEASNVLSSKLSDDEKIIRLKEIGKICNNEKIENPLIVTDSGSAKLPFIKNLQEYLASSNVKSNLFYDISPNPREDEVSAGCKI